MDYDLLIQSTQRLLAQAKRPEPGTRGKPKVDWIVKTVFRPFS